MIIVTVSILLTGLTNQIKQNDKEGKIFMDKEKINQLWDKYKDMIPYVIFGVLTTVVNIVAYWLFYRVFHVYMMVSNIIAWFASVLFAYLTNRKWVFHSEAETFEDYRKEILAFFAARLGTGILDWLIMFIFAKQLGLNDMVIKIVSNVVVIVLNYVASKFWIFKSKK